MPPREADGSCSSRKNSRSDPNVQGGLGVNEFLNDGGGVFFIFLPLFGFFFSGFSFLVLFFFGGDHLT